MKFAGLVILGLSISFSGFYISYYHRKRVNLLLKLSDFFENFSSNSLLENYEIIEYFNKQSASSNNTLSFLNEMGKNYSFGCDMKNLWKKSVKDSNEVFFLDSFSKNRLLTFCEIFGKISQKEFSEKCLIYSEFFNSAAKKETLKWEKNGALTVSLFVLVSAALFIILM